MQMTKVQGSVLETEGEVGSIPAKEVGKSLHPVVRLVGVQRFVVEGGHHLGHRLLGVGSGNHRRPSLLDSRLQLGGETLPLDAEVLVGPRDVDLASRQIGPVLANVGDVHRKTAAHRLRDFLFDFGLRHSLVRPKGLKRLSPMDDFHESATPRITCAPHGFEGIARLDRPSGSGDVIRYLDPETPGIGLYHEYGQEPLHLFAEAILGLKNRPIGALLQLEGKVLVPLGVGGEPLSGHDFAKLPRAGVGKVWLGLYVHSPSTTVEMTVPSAELGSLNAFRFLETMNLKRALGNAPFPIQRGSLESYLNGIALGLPLLG